MSTAGIRYPHAAHRCIFDSMFAPSPASRPTAPAPQPGPITALREHPRRSGRYLLEIGGVPAGPVSVESIAELGLRPGVTLDAAGLERALAATRRVACFDHAVDALARRARSRRELERWLGQRGHAPDAVEAATERLAALGLLDDRAFATGFAQTRAKGRGFGARRIAAELARRGVARGVVDEALAALRESEGEGTETEALEAAAAKRARSLAGLEPEVARRRLVGWLVRRGFAAGAAARVARRLIAGVALVAAAVAPARAQRADAARVWKVNTASALIGVVEVAHERPAGDRTTLHLAASGAYWQSFDGAPLQFLMLLAELRRHADLRVLGWRPYAGLHAGATLFRLQKWEYWDTSLYQEGVGVIAGATFGFERPIGAGWVLDAYVGGGTHQSLYRGFDLTTGERYDKPEGLNKSGEWLPYRLGLMLGRRVR